MTALPVETERHALYRFHDEGGELLYVGITSDLERRIDQHQRSKPWWSVSRKHSTSCPGSSGLPTRGVGMTEQTEGAEVDWEAVDLFAQEIRRVDGNHDLGAGALAEALWPLLAAYGAAAEARGAERGWLHAADEVDSAGHHWSGAPARTFFALADDLRARAAAAAAGGGVFDKALAETRSEFREALDRLGES